MFEKFLELVERAVVAIERIADHVCQKPITSPASFPANDQNDSPATEEDISSSSGGKKTKRKLLMDELIAMGVEFPKSGTAADFQRILDSEKAKRQNTPVNLVSPSVPVAPNTPQQPVNSAPPMQTPAPIQQPQSQAPVSPPVNYSPPVQTPSNPIFDQPQQTPPPTVEEVRAALNAYCSRYAPNTGNADADMQVGSQYGIALMRSVTGIPSITYLSQVPTDKYPAIIAACRQE